MANDYTFSNESMFAGNNNIPSDLKAQKMIPDSLMNSVGIYSKSDIESARYSRYSRFGRVLDPYGRLNDTREYLFFVKPDLHICVVDFDSDSPSNVYKVGGYNDSYSYSELIGHHGLKLNPQLNNNAYFVDLIDRYPDVIKELQDGINKGSTADHFSHLLSFSVNSGLDIPGQEASTLDNPSTIFGTNYEYLKDSESSDENPSFSLEFVDTKRLEVYHFFKAYAEYHIARKSGLVTPPSANYWKYKRLHNTMGIYKFLVAEDMETIIYWAYFWGVYPISVPRESFSDAAFQDGLTFSVNFKAAFVEDMNPLILNSFNQLMSPLIKDKNDWLPTIYQSYSADRYLDGRSRSYKSNLDDIVGRTEYVSTDSTGKKYTTYYNGGTDRINGTLPRAALVDPNVYNNESPKYRLRWYA